MTDQGYAKIIEHEGEVLHCYYDGNGYATIGVGHLIDERRGGSIPQRVSRLLLEDDLARATAQARQYDWFDRLDPVRQDVVIEMIFALGADGFRSFRLLRNAIELAQWQEAAFQIANSKAAREQWQQSRVSDLCAAMEKGKWS